VNKTIIVLYLVAFGVSLRFFLKGQHECAWMLMIGSFLVLLGCVLRRDRRVQ
jgi:hypothetical protein